jgi:hypothetical protein
MNRRGLLGGLLATLAAPAIIRTPGLLMPVSTLALPVYGPSGVLTLAMIAREFNRRLQCRVPSEVNRGRKQTAVSFDVSRFDLQLSLGEFSERFLVPAAENVAKCVGDGALAIGEMRMIPWGYYIDGPKLRPDEHRGVIVNAISGYSVGLDRQQVRLDVMHS